MKAFTIYPAIDLRNGRVARLRQGDPYQVTLYSNDPASVAKHWIDSGCHWLHIVNLDGAFGEEDSQNMKALQKILDMCRSLDVKVQFGGGLRSINDLKHVFDLGVDRVVLGSLAVEKTHLLESLLSHFTSERIAIAVDVRNDKIWKRGWREQSHLSANEMVQHLASLGFQTLIYTDIQRDGTGSGLNLEYARSLLNACGLDIIIAGGVQSLEDIRQAQQVGLAGVITGRALYDGQINLHQAIGVSKGIC